VLGDSDKSPLLGICCHGVVLVLVQRDTGDWFHRYARSSTATKRTILRTARAVNHHVNGVLSNQEGSVMT